MNLRTIFKRKPKKTAEVESFNSSAFYVGTEQANDQIREPITLAKLRLEQGANDMGAEQGNRLYSHHKTKVYNQWINALQSVNSGYGNSHNSFYNYQASNYWECYTLAQDPLFNKIFNILSRTPFMNGGEVAGEVTDEDKDLLAKADDKYKLTDTLTKAVRSSFVCGGCLIYIDLGEDVKLDEPLDLNTVDLRNFRGFKHIDPINVTAIEVNTTEPAKSDYMSPKIWYVIGLGAVHYTHFLKFDENLPELVMRPLTMYFGTPLTSLIKQDVANSNLASQGLANLINRFRYLYLQTESSNFTGAGASAFRNRLEVMSRMQDNFGVYPLKDTETIQQFTTSISGLYENVEFFYQIIAAKTDITFSILMGKGASGLSGTLEGERKNFYDRIRSIQANVKPNLLVMIGIIYAAETDGKFKRFEDYVYNPLEVANEKEKAENLRSYSEVAKSLVELGVSGEKAIEWLKNFKEFKLDSVEVDTDTFGLEDYNNEDSAGVNINEDLES